MILTILESERMRQILLKSNHHNAVVMNHEVSFIQSEGRWHVHLPYNLIMQEHTLADQKEMIIRNRDTGETAMLKLYENSEGFDCWKRYELKPQIAVGEDDNGNITIRSDADNDTVMLVLIDEMRLDPFENTAACNGRRIMEACRFHDGDLITFGNLRLLLEGDSLFVNDCKNIHVALNPYACQARKPQKITVSCITAIRSLDVPLQPVHSITLPQPEQNLYCSEGRPFIFAIGPALMMSMASLFVGILSAWRAWMQGREVIDVLPMLVLPCVMLISTLIWNPLSHLDEKKKRRKEKDRILKSYQKELAQLSEEIRQQEHHFRQISSDRFPYPEKLSHLLMNSSVHEIHSSSETMLLRAGDIVGKNGIQVQITWKEKDPELREMIDAFTRSLQKEFQMPWLIDLREYRSICIACGENQDDLFLYLILQLYWVYGLRFAFLLHQPENDQKVWIRRLTAWKNQKRMIFQNEEEALDACRRYHLILVSDKPPDNLNEEVLCLMKGNAEDCQASLVLDLQTETYLDHLHHRSGSFSFTISESFDPERICDRIPYEMLSEEKDNGFLAMYGCEKAEDLNVEERWQNHDVSTSLCAFLGMDESGKRIELNLNERKDGPHGLIAGMTGSGKSELIITMLLSLAVNYSPQDVQFALIDFKGGGISQAIGTGSDALAHIAGILTNLDTDDMERALVSFHQECIRREKLIAQMNRIADVPVMNLQDYRRCQSEHAEMPGLAELIIVIDEFAELKREKPEFLQDLISIARIGRSLGVHLILSTQKPGGSVSDEIWTNCSFKICLRVSQRQDSFEMLHNEDACMLQESGSFLLLSNGRMQKGRGAYANMRHGLSACRVKIRDDNGKVMQDSITCDQSGPPEILSVLHTIHEKAERYEPASPLWQNPLDDKTVSMAPQGKQIFARYDDFHHQKQPWLSLPFTGSVLFVSMDLEEKKNLLHTVLYALLSSMNRNEELYLIDDLGIPMEKLKKVRMFTDSFSSEYEDKRNRVIERLLDQKSQRQRSVLILDDLTVFLSESQENALLLQNLLEQAEKKNILLIMMCSTMQNIPYRLTGLISQRYVLHCEKASEVQQVLECCGQHVQKKKGWGLLRKDVVLEFCYLKCMDKEMDDLIHACMEKYGPEKPYRIPCMPEKISVSSYHGVQIPLGLKERDFSWCTIPPVESVAVVAMYPDELEKIRKILSPYSKCRYPEEADVDDAQVVLTDFDAWMKSRPETEAVLLIGETFRQQFVYRCRRKSLKENEGLFCYGHEREVIRIVEK